MQKSSRSLLQTKGRGIKYVTPREGSDLLDRQARKYLNMSGAEFLRAYESGRFKNDDRSDVVRVAMLVPFAKS